jgi:hypothetical protein
MTGLTSDVRVMQPAQSWRRHCAATTVAGNQKPGAEFRPGSILQFQFPE